MLLFGPIGAIFPCIFSWAPPPLVFSLIAPRNHKTPIIFLPGAQQFSVPVQSWRWWGMSEDVKNEYPKIKVKRALNMSQIREFWEVTPKPPVEPIPNPGIAS